MLSSDLIKNSGERLNWMFIMDEFIVLRKNNIIILRENDRKVCEKAYVYCLL